MKIESEHVAAFQNLATELAYDPDRLQSKVLPGKEVGKKILFAFAPGQQLPAHTAPVEVLLIALEGHAVLTLEDGQHAFGAGEVVRLPAGAPHGIRALSYFKMLLCK